MPSYLLVNEVVCLEEDVIITIDAGLAHRDDLKSEWTTARHSVEQRPLSNVGIGEIKDINLVGIHHNGSFTKVWISMKTVFTPWILVASVWYWHRIGLLARPPVLLEKVILALGVSMTILNVPVEWLSLGCDWTWMLLLEDAQQGVFYTTLFCFWIIFCGEHLVDQNQRNRLSACWWQVGLVMFGSSILLAFDLSER
ncbi:hypothetical protein CesoFtcFv8_004567 [Champsocephalus esox]|uniref:Wntless-like transmembrane domain-containing protein n=1 Tax=Champsocephalus esox TaxID=159716 RepID=A0AAN8CMM6_9TELE|nr:hypothetical protein CesoFtcFv8_004567 [Champsocephalus esox]